MSEYEIDKDGNRQIVKSLDTNRRSFITFINKSRRPVDVFWINYVGIPEKYKQLLPWQFFDVNTFTSHPWMFRDAITQERYVINNRSVFRGPSNVKREDFNITAPLRPLKLSAMVRLAEYINEKGVAYSLDLPKSVAQELSDMVALYKPR